MTEFIQVATTFGNRQHAERMAADLIDRHLAACVQICGPVHSTFRWQGVIENSEEWICFIKSSRARFDDVEKVILQTHPFDIPEIIVTPIIGGSQAYLAWLEEQLSET